MSKSIEDFQNFSDFSFSYMVRNLMPFLALNRMPEIMSYIWRYAFQIQRGASFGAAPSIAGGPFLCATANQPVSVSSGFDVLAVQAVPLPERCAAQLARYSTSGTI